MKSVAVGLALSTPKDGQKSLTSAKYVTHTEGVLRANFERGDIEDGWQIGVSNSYVMITCNRIGKILKVPEK